MLTTRLFIEFTNTLCHFSIRKEIDSLRALLEVTADASGGAGTAVDRHPARRRNNIQSDFSQSLRSGKHGTIHQSLLTYRQRLQENSFRANRHAVYKRSEIRAFFFHRQSVEIVLTPRRS